MLIMSPPLYFDVKHYGLNPYMKRGNSINKDLAISQWNNLYKLIRSLGIKVYLVKAVVNLVDMVFSANCGFIYNNFFIPTKFKDKYRRAEIKYYTDYIEKLGYKIKPMKHYFEGQGDVVCNERRDNIYIGYGIRTSKIGANKVKTILLDKRNISVTLLKLVDPYFYHLDTCMRIFDDNKVLYYPDAFSKMSQKIIKKHFDVNNRIAVTKKEALDFCCNCFTIQTDNGGIYIANKTSKRLRKLINKFNFKCIDCPMTELIKAGGSVKCCIFEI